MEKYRLYKIALTEKEGEKWEKTSFVGTKETIKAIRKDLSNSKYHRYEMLLEFI